MKQEYYTESDPWQIATLANLYWITASDAVVTSTTQATRWTKYYIQTANSDSTATSGWNTGRGFSPVGTETDKFTGSYNGNYRIVLGCCLSTTFHKFDESYSVILIQVEQNIGG